MRRYFNILGIEPTTDRDVIKKAYRKLALQYHPDRNPAPDAQERFIAINEAYEQIIDALDNPRRTSTQNSSTSNSYTVRYRTATREEKMEFARRQWEKMRQMEEEEDEKLYKHLTSGINWNIFRIITLISTILAFIIIIDHYFLPNTIERETIQSTKEDHAFAPEKILLVKLEKGKTIYLRNQFIHNLNLGDDFYLGDDILNHSVRQFGIAHSISDYEFLADILDTIYATPEYVEMIKDNYITVERSMILKDVKRVHSHYPQLHYTQTAEPIHDIVNAYFTIIIFLLLPMVTYFTKSKSVSFNLMFHITKYAIPILIAYVLLTNNHWLHILTLGFY